MNEFEKMRKEFPSLAKDMLNIYNVQYKMFTYQSLKQLEKRMNEIFPLNTADLYNQFFVGFYLGEVLVRNFEKAKWATGDYDSIWDISITIPVTEEITQTFFPFRRARKFFENREYGLSVCYEQFRDIKKRKINTNDFYQSSNWKSYGEYKLKFSDIANDNDIK